MHKITKRLFKEMQVPTPEMAAKDVECWNKYNNKGGMDDNKRNIRLHPNLVER